MWKGRVLMGVRQTGVALERRANLVRRDMSEYDGDVRVLFLVFEVPEESVRQVLWLEKKQIPRGKPRRHSLNAPIPAPAQ